jgi:acyl-coenzyme A thioesterase PaaI-like protein
LTYYRQNETDALAPITNSHFTERPDDLSSTLVTPYQPSRAATTDHALQLRERVLRSLALDRTPGYHFTGHFLSPSFDQVSAETARVSLKVGPHSADAKGNLDYGALVVFADLAVAANVRAGHDLATRLATVSLSMHFLGAPISGIVEASTSLNGYLLGTACPQGAGTFAIIADKQPVCFGTGTFMVLDPPQGMTLHRRQLRRTLDPDAAPLSEEDLTLDERLILQRADEAIAACDDGAFLRRFWGFETKRIPGGATGILKNGPHISNRVGHVQGGVTMGLGIATAEAAMPTNWVMSAVSAWFIRPCEGETIRAESRIIHEGRLTSVLRTEIVGKNDRRVMEMMTMHGRKA